MVHFRGLFLFATLSLLEVLPLGLAHGHDEHGSSLAVDEGAAVSVVSAALGTPSAMASSAPWPESYFAHKEMSGLMVGHIALMTIAWFFILPIGVMLSIARSRLSLLVQLAFLAVHSAGLLLSMVYMGRVPDLYPNNSHHKLGWIITWVVVAQCVIGIIRLAVNIGKSRDTGSVDERATFLPVSSETATPTHEYQRLHSPDPYRYSHDSGHFTASESSRSHSVSSSTDREEEEQRKLREYEAAHDAVEEASFTEKRGLMANPKVERLATRIASIISTRTLRILEVFDNLVNRLILLLGFVAIVSGIAVYGGVFRGSGIFSGLAHTIKGGIFFWYGLLTLGRWMGCFVEYGWAWNVRPPVGVVSPRQAKVPTAEFTESFVIWLYGFSNVFLEHLAAWGHEWSPMDLEHVSISIMFFGGGLCGMLIESQWIRDLLNSIIETSPSVGLTESTRERLTAPKSYPFSLNPMPALIILLLGLMMSSHHQNTAVSTMVHKQWGTLLMGFALARAITYLLIYLAPPTSYLPSRPPTELIASFCLISGGIIFMASNASTMAVMDAYHIHAMFPFTVTMGFTAFLMAWAIIVLAVKGWAVRRQPPKMMMRHHS